MFVPTNAHVHIHVSCGGVRQIRRRGSYHIPPFSRQFDSAFAIMPGNGNKFTTFSTRPWTESTSDWRHNELCTQRIRSLRALGSHCAADGVVLPNLLREIDGVIKELVATTVSDIISSIEMSGFACDRSCVRVMLTQLQVICTHLEPLPMCMWTDFYSCRSCGRKLVNKILPLQSKLSRATVRRLLS